MSQLDSIIFGDKKFSDILEEIYTNQKKKSKQVTALISELKPLINEIGDATLIVPLIKEYMEIGVKNDDALIKMATIIQRAVQNEGEDGSLGISDEEKEALMVEMDKLSLNKDKK
ncbi:MAG: hypothetical protein HOA86_05140 [Gammaproteobacteria bacterium]|jgi:hypothetical protein|nr:hypothetical protein [Gammaproteobacteria bacterium]